MTRSPAFWARSSISPVLRAVATRLSPAIKTASASARPSPREHPVISQVFGMWFSSWGRRPFLQNDARIADALIAVDQVHLLGLDLPRRAVAHHAMAGPAGQHARLVAPELADQEIRAQHALVLAPGGKGFHIGDQPHGARGRRLRPGEAGAKAVDAVLQPAAVIEHYRDLAPRIARGGRRRDPIDALRRVEREPGVVAQLVEQPWLPLGQHA